MSCTVAGADCEMVPPDPDPEFTGQLLAAATRLAAGGPMCRLLTWATGRAVGRVRLAAAEASSWRVVARGRGRRAGVEFHRLTPCL